MSSFTQPRVARECAGRTCARIKIQRLNHRSWLRASFFCIALQYQNECRIEQNVWKTNKVKDIANVGLSVETAKVVLTNCSCQQLIISFKLSNVANLRIIYIYIWNFSIRITEVPRLRKDLGQNSAVGHDFLSASYLFKQIVFMRCSWKC